MKPYIMDKVLFHLLQSGIEKRVFPGAVAGLSTGFGKNRKRYFSVAGIKDITFPAEKVNEETFFDLASLTKPLSTTLILYSLIHEKKVKFDEVLSDFFKNVPSDKNIISIRQLLSHSSGLKGYSPYFKELKPIQNKNNSSYLLESILREQQEYIPETKCCYSDLGFILLGCLIEKVTGTPLELLFKQRIAAPLGLEQDIMYIPVKHGKNVKVDKKNFASTENCPWRKKIMRAEVHDEHCWLMNGVSGHAGLFGRIGAVVRLCEEILDQYKKRGKKFSWSEIIQTGLQKQYADQSWCLGFDTPSLQGSSGGNYLSAQSIGHLGYTGTSFWIDPEKEIIMVLLTNRVHPTRNNIAIRVYRPYFHNRIIEELGFAENKKGS